MLRLQSLLVAAALTSAAMAQLTVTIPNGFAAAEGSTSNAFPWNRFSATQNLQQQMFYDSTHFTAQGINFPILITKLKWRANAVAATTSWVGGTQTGCWVDMSTAAVDQALVTTNMASNHGANLTRVYSGNVTVLPGTGNGTGVPGPTLVDLPITPFLYDPMQGDLCIDAFVPANSWASATGTSVDVHATAPLASRVYNSTNAAAGTIGLNHGTIVTLEYTPAAGLYPAFTASTTAGNSPLAVNFTDHTYSSAPGGVLAWSWDFDGDNVVDSTAQNPTFVYASCGTYSVSLTVVDASNPAATLTKTGYIVVDAISANFTASVGGGFTPLGVQFTDTSTGPVSTWIWDLDGDTVPDAAVQNPTWTYTTPGTYTVTLTVSNACRTDVRTRTNLITVLAPGSTPAPAELMQYQFNEVRGQVAANTASGVGAPSAGAYGTANWWSEAAHAGFRGNEAGFGCLGYRSTGAGWINTGWNTAVSGSFSTSFWLKRDPASTVASPFGYAWGNGTFRAFVAGAAGTGITFRGSAIGNVDSGFPVINTPGVWQHLTLVVDDAAGQARWYDNGVPSATVVSFTPNTFNYTSAILFGVGAMNSTGSSPIGAHFYMDDFRFYSRALTPAEVQLIALLPEQASAGAFGSSCNGPAGMPVIGANGNPTTGNASFAVNLSNAEDNRLAAMVLGFGPAAFGTMSVAPWIGAGCELQTDIVGLNFFVTSANAASQAFPIPAGPAFAGLHVYGQWLVLGTTGAATRLLDINIQ